MRKILNNLKTLPISIKGMIFVLTLMMTVSSCCVTGYCQIPTTDMQKEAKDKQTNN